VVGRITGFAAKTLVAHVSKAFIITLMIFTTTAPQLPQTRLSGPALLVVSVVHFALFWLLLQTAPVQRAVRETVVMLNLPITQPLPKPPPKKVITSPKPTEPVKPIEKPVVVKKTITKPAEPLPEPPKPLVPPKPPEPPKPVEKPVVIPKSPEKVVEVKPVEVQVPKEVVKEVVPETPKVLPQEVLKPVVAELPPTPMPAPAPVAPAAVVATPVTAAPVAAAPVAEPAKAVAPAAVASSPAAPAVAPALATSTGASNRAISTNSITPSGSATAASAPLGSGAPSLSGALANPSGSGNLGAPLAGSGSNYVPGRRGGWAAGELQRASSAQLNPHKRSEKYEDEFKNAIKEDCLKPAKDAAGKETNRGLLALPQLINRVTSGDCPN
jgi:hypothetical protein